MIIVHGDIFDDESDFITIPVNCQGVMGAGLALQFIKRYPEMFRKYQKACYEGSLRPGGTTVEVDFASGRRFIFAATKNKWRDRSRLEWVGDICQTIKIMALNGGVSIAVPALGCGRGKLDWYSVHKLMNIKFDGINEIRVYTPWEVVDDGKNKEKSKEKEAVPDYGGELRQG